MVRKICELVDSKRGVLDSHSSINLLWLMLFSDNYRHVTKAGLSSNTKNQNERQPIHLPIWSSTNCFQKKFIKHGLSINTDVATIDSFTTYRFAISGYESARFCGSGRCLDIVPDRCPSLKYGRYPPHFNLFAMDHIRWWRVAIESCDRYFFFRHGYSPAAFPGLGPTVILSSALSRHNRCPVSSVYGTYTTRWGLEGPLTSMGPAYSPHCHRPVGVIERHPSAGRPGG